jgi:propanol-preferring alcohol dehydrogenase
MMKAVVMHAFGKPLTIGEVPIPGPGPGESIVPPPARVVVECEQFRPVLQRDLLENLDHDVALLAPTV